MDRTIIKADKDFDGKISFTEFCDVSLTFKMDTTMLIGTLISKKIWQKCLLEQFLISHLNFNALKTIKVSAQVATLVASLC